MTITLNPTAVEIRMPDSEPRYRGALLRRGWALRPRKATRDARPLGRRVT